MLPTILACLQGIHQDKGGPPRTIYVTGHSLGGALACNFTSAMLLSNTYGPYGMGSKMPDELKPWPWRSMQLITFAAPVVGGKTFQKVFDVMLASRRIWLDGDFITQERRHNPVGIAHRIPKSKILGGRISMTVISKESHEPSVMRRYLIQELKEYQVNLDNVPANTGKEELTEPWKIFKTCLEMLQHLNELKKTFDYDNFFPYFGSWFSEYLSTLQSILEKQEQTIINDLVKNMGDIVDDDSNFQDRANSLYKLLNNNIDNRKKLKTELLNFIRTCMVLVLLQSNNGDDPDWNTIISNPSLSYIKNWLNYK
ncbi:lipase family protein [Moorena producens]|uniref:lipase family protein n=1 Tax=Moorena producens TaxID=1155739 RepID=UPI003C7423D9